MAKKERPLPRHPGSPFGIKKRIREREGESSLTADRMAEAMAAGKLEKFLQHEIPDNEYAQKLTMMMMGMTGMMPSSGFAPAGEDRAKQDRAGKEAAQGTEPRQVPDDVVLAAQTGDVKGLMDLLGREHRKRTYDQGPSEEMTERSSPLSLRERETLDEIMKIAGENGVSVDWLVLRALMVYVREYRKTGNL